jgi:DNA mismatch repair protein MSH5
MTSNVWLCLQRFAHNALNIRETLAQIVNSEKIQVVRKVMEVVEHGPFHLIGELITQTVDFEQSRERQRTAVRQGVDVELDELKRRYHGMEDFLTEVNVKLRADIPEWAQHYVQGCVFYPQLGFLTVVSHNTESGNANYQGEGLTDNWERIFADNGAVYCKNARMKEIDELYGDAYCMIIGKQSFLYYRVVSGAMTERC